MALTDNARTRLHAAVDGELDAIQKAQDTAKAGWTTKEKAYQATIAEREALIAELTKPPVPEPPVPEPPTPVPPVPEPPAPKPVWTPDTLVYLTQGPPLRSDEPRYKGYGAHERKLGISNQGRDWSPGSVPKVIPPYPRQYAPTGELYTHHNAWFEVCVSAGGTDPEHRDVRVQLAVDFVGQLLPATDLLPRRWVVTKTFPKDAPMDGAFWNGGDVYSPTERWPGRAPNPYWRTEADGWSFTTLPMTTPDGKVDDTRGIAHGFWPTVFMPRVPLQPGAQVAILGRMRLITDNPKVDVSKARITGGMSGDAFSGPTVVVGKNGHNPSLTHCRHMALGEDWRPVGICTGTADEIRAYPPIPTGKGA